MSFGFSGRSKDLELRDPIGVTRISCRILRFPLHEMFRKFIVFSDFVTCTCCFELVSANVKKISLFFQ